MLARQTPVPSHAGVSQRGSAVLCSQTCKPFSAEKCRRRHDLRILTSDAENDF